MTHQRKTIRDNITDTLTNLRTTRSNVFQSRIYPMSDVSLPGILIYNKTEQTLYQSIGIPRLQERTTLFDIEIYVKETNNFDDKIDQICLEVEEALCVDVTRGGNALDTQILSFESDFNGDGEQPLAVGRLTVEVKYQVRENNPDVGI